MQPYANMQPTAETQVRVNTFVRSVYNWMAAGLAITGVVAYLFATNASLFQLMFQISENRLQPTMLFYGAIIAELVLVFSISARVQKMQASTATGLFMLYAALNGATLSSIFIMFTQASIVSTFFICAGTFLACSIFGWTTKKDLTSMGGFMFMGLIGIIIATVVNLFLRSPMITTVVSYIGVIVFVGLTAYDTQKLKSMAMSQPDGLDAAVVRKGAIIGALTLYLDFINLFIMLLHIFGRRE
jgi:FtsH-binding integral membrane protein